MEENTLQRYDFGKNCVVIGRASTDVQNKTAQINDLKKYAKGLGYKKVEPFFTSESGFLEYDSKQGWNIVTDFFEAHTDYRVLICTEMSRLSRKEAILQKIKDYLKENKIQLIIKDISFSLFDEWGNIPKGNDVVFALFASLADSEMKQKKERFRRALEDYRKEGFSIGGKRLFGYNRKTVRKDGKERNTYIINEKEAEEIRTIYKWYAYGIDGNLTNTSIVSITKKCIEEGFSPYLHSKRNVNKCLKEAAYTGRKETHNRVHNAEYWNYRQFDRPKYIEGKSFICTYPIILAGDDAALFEIVQQRLIENNSKLSKEGTPVDKSTIHTTILSKLIKCPECGSYLCGDYRQRIDSHRKGKQMRYSYSYRCSKGRGSLNKCSFTHTINMPITDSVVWAYCKRAVFHILSTEKRTNTQEQIDAISNKIHNIEDKIHEYNIEAKIKAEDAILRARASMLKSPEEIQSATLEYKKRVDGFNKEIKDYQERLLELKQERENICSGHIFLSDLRQQIDEITSKKQIYDYIHKLVDSIEIITSDVHYSVFRVHLKSYFNSYRTDEFICVKKTTRNYFNTLVVHPVDKSLVNKARETISCTKKFSQAQIEDFIETLPSNNDLRWDKETKTFEIEGVYFSLDDLFEYYNNPMGNHSSPEEQLMRINLGMLPIKIKKLDAERLNCYNEDALRGK